jgi:Cu/Zn superoxide dismutase
LWCGVAAAVLCAVACGGGQTATAPSPTPSPAAGSPNPTPSPTPLNFRLVPEPGVTASGTIALTAGPGTTTIELSIKGLAPNSSHVSHIHLGSCQARGGIAFALNQVVADGQGMADVRSRLDLTYPPSGSTWYVVVHAGPDMVGSNATYLLCGNLFS